MMAENEVVEAAEVTVFWVSSFLMVVELQVVVVELGHFEQGLACPFCVYMVCEPSHAS